MLKDYFLSCPAPIKAQFVSRRYAAGETILYAGEALDCVYLIVSGRVEVIVPGMRSELLNIGAYGEWELLGELEFFSRVPVQSSVWAKTACEVMQIDGAVFLQWLNSDNALCICLLSMLSNRFVSLSSFAKVGVTGMLNQRVAYLLMTYADEKGVLPFSKATLAQRAGTSQRSLNRILKTLSEQGLVDCSTTLVKVLNAKGLDQIYKNER